MTDPAPLVLQALDARIAWWAPPDARAWLHERLADLVVAADPSSADVEFRWTATDGGWRCVHDDAHMQAESMHDCLGEAMIVLNRMAAASVAADRLVLHAGVVSPEPGRAIALCGRSGAGKSTATTAACLAGWTFVADEVCAIDTAAWQVRPYPRPIGLRAGGARALGIERDRDDTWRPPTLAIEPPVLDTVVLLNRRPGPPQLHRLSAAAALEALADHTLSGTGLDGRVFRRLEQLVRAVPVMTAAYEHAPHLIEQLRTFSGHGADGPAA